MTSERRKKIRQRRKARSKNRIVKWFRGLSKKKKALLIAGAVALLLFAVAIIYVAVHLAIIARVLYTRYRHTKKRSTPVSFYRYEMKTAA